jgi:hypothetical protein
MAVPLLSAAPTVADGADVDESARAIVAATPMIALMRVT